MEPDLVRRHVPPSPAAPTLCAAAPPRMRASVCTLIPLILRRHACCSCLSETRHRRRLSSRNKKALRGCACMHRVRVSHSLHPHAYRRCVAHVYRVSRRRASSKVFLYQASIFRRRFLLFFFFSFLFSSRISRIAIHITYIDKS